MANYGVDQRRCELRRRGVAGSRRGEYSSREVISKTNNCVLASRRRAPNLVHIRRDDVVRVLSILAEVTRPGAVSRQLGSGADATGATVRADIGLHLRVSAPHVPLRYESPGLIPPEVSLPVVV